MVPRRCIQSAARPGVTLAALCLVCVVPATVGGAAPAGRLDSVLVGAWGEIPAPHDSVTAVFTNRSRAAWEWPLYVPYAAVNYPLRGIREGIGKGVIWAERKELFRYINLVPVPRGVVPSLDYSQQEGFGVGADVYLQLLSPDNPARLRAKYSTARWQKYTVGSILNEGGRWELHLGGGYRLRPNLEFYGIGPNTVVGNAAYYKDERAWGGMNIRRRLPRNMFLAFAGVYSTIDARQPDRDNYPTLLDVYENTRPPGYGERSNGVMLRLSWFMNTSGEEGNPNRGTLLGASVGGFVATNTDDVSFLAYRFEFQQFLPLWHSRRALALRGYLNFIDDTGTAAIPFQRMFINEVPDMFRGYDTGRWRDLGITGINAEYRYPFVADRTDGGFGIDVVAITDVGQVFSEVAEFNVDNLTYSYGVGLRAYMNEYFVGSMEFVWSEEGFQFRLTTKQLFQYSRDVLFQGREETLIH